MRKPKIMHLTEIMKNLFMLNTAVISRTVASERALWKSLIAALIVLPFYMVQVEAKAYAFESMPLFIAIALAGYFIVWVFWPVFVMETYGKSGSVLAYLALHNWLRLMEFAVSMVCFAIASYTGDENIKLLVVVFYGIYEIFLLKTLVKQDWVTTIALFFLDVSSRALIEGQIFKILKI